MSDDFANDPASDERQYLRKKQENLVKELSEFATQRVVAFKDLERGPELRQMLLLESIVTALLTTDKDRRYYSAAMRTYEDWSQKLVELDKKYPVS